MAISEIPADAIVLSFGDDWQGGEIGNRARRAERGRLPVDAAKCECLIGALARRFESHGKND
jgi:hypothetical protein